MSSPLRHLRLDGLGGWFLCAVLAAFVVASTSHTRVPIVDARHYSYLWLGAVAVALVVASLMAALFRPAARRLRAAEAMAILVVMAMIITDVVLAAQPLRDLGIYLKAGQHYLAGSPVYMQGTMTVLPRDLTDLPFLYPPITLPFFGALSLLPVQLAQAIWVGGSVSLGLLALRWLGLPWRWAGLALMWPPLFLGLWVGNVAVPAFALFALGPLLGAGLVLGATFKSYTGIASLWLITERRWVEAGVGIGVLLVLAAVTLPLTGAELWWKWFDGLRLYQNSQTAVPALYGFGLPRFIPYAVYLAVAVAAIAAALLVRGRDSLARLGTATIVASPSLFGHGLLVAVPSLLSLRSPWLWLAIGFACTPESPWWLLAVGVIVLSWIAPAMRRAASPAAAAAEVLHPLGADGVLWAGLRPAGRPRRP